MTGFGVSLPHAEAGPTRARFSALPTVPTELEGITIRERSDDKDGVLPGRYFLNEDFTKSVLRWALRYPVLHVASHFRLQPGNESQSFLLLGDGNALELRQIREDNYDFGNIDLLTFSACDTAVGEFNAKGRETEGLGTLAQEQGAKGVIATLWPVADASTGCFMQQLYWLRVEKGLSKAEALRQTQLAFLRGEIRCVLGNEDKRQPVYLGDDSPATAASFTTDPNCPYAHPY
jgi:CHAT domain-containing protein